MVVSGQFHASAALPQGNSLLPRYSFDRRAGEPQNQLGLCGEEKNLSLQGLEPGPSIPT
jgi:hypothetical protein